MMKSGEEIVREILFEESQLNKIKEDYSILNEIENPFEEKQKEIQNKTFGKILGKITDKIELAREFCEIVPLFYDSTGSYWIWDDIKKYWKTIDELDVLIWIDNSAEINVINSKE
ncbi:MAG: hypothetical protein WD512_03480, partial [Candidatus Paceibacterota bacterium]